MTQYRFKRFYSLSSLWSTGTKHLETWNCYI